MSTEIILNLMFLTSIFVASAARLTKRKTLDLIMSSMAMAFIMSLLVVLVNK